MNDKVSINDALSGITQYFSPRIIGEVNDVYIKLAKIKGQDIPWHSHDLEDELFFVLSGELILQQKDNDDIRMKKGDMYIVSKGILHRVFATDECSIMLIENKGSKHTGDVKNSITKSVTEQKY